MVRLSVVLAEEGSVGTSVQLVKPEMALLRSCGACHFFVWPEIAGSLSKESQERVHV